MFISGLDAYLEVFSRFEYLFVYIIQGDQIVCMHLTQCIRTIPTQLMIWKWPSQNTFWMWTVLYWTRSSRTQFGVSINVWSLAGDTLNITCNYLYFNHQVHRDFLITLYTNVRKLSSWGSIFSGVLTNVSIGGSCCVL